jgi:hypothetical protein
LAPVVKGERAGGQFGLRECDGRRAPVREKGRCHGAPVREKWRCAGAICERDADRRAGSIGSKRSKGRV